MAGWRAENKHRRELLTDLARELRQECGLAHRARPRLWLTWQLRPCLLVRTAAGGMLRVYCAGAAGRYVLLTGSGQVIGLGEGVAAAAAAVAAACAGHEPGESAAARAAEVQPGP
jgi:hypothetical protein